MERVHLDGVGHSYGGATYALEKADIVFEGGRTYALLGPSGCGKTTMLNIISGLVHPSDGRVLLGADDVTRRPTAKRNIAQVFQFPVVYRLKTVFENLAFPLRCRQWDQARIRSRVGEIADLLGLTARLGQSARRLSADEKQLISLGRGLVRNDVAALLMDEPLTVIDPQMKSELRRKIKQVNDQTRHTVIYVTHDQNEAMTFADEILVMKAGRVVQRGTPKELFENPRDTYVGNFIGSPGMNFVGAQRVAGGVAIGGAFLPIGRRQGAIPAAGELMVGIRPEHLSFTHAGNEGVPATLGAVQDHGSIRILDLAVETGRVKMKVRRGTAIPAGPLRLTFPAERVRLYVDGVLQAPAVATPEP